MPQAANQTEKKYNPTVTALFRNPKFGEDGLLSANLDAKGFEALQKHAQVGVKFLVRKSPRLNMNGGETFYLEILPPLANPGAMKQRTSRPAPSADDDV